MDDYYRLPGHLIRRLHQISVSLFAAEMAEAGLDLTPLQFAALAALSRSPGVDQVTLAGLLAYDRVTMSGVIDRLQKRGYVRREVSPRDRRARVLNLTDAGREVLAVVGPAVLRVQEDTLDGLDAGEREVLVELLARAVDAGNERTRAPLRLGDG